MVKRDVNQLAKFIVDQAAGDEPTKVKITPKKLASSKGGKVGGKQRMASLTPEQKRDLALRGVAVVPHPPDC